ncbi:MAG TPA: PD-(D/E)XK nuclease family protein [Pirellula sp.]|nr:PD-(D/E)XK nuclease family protein [Pirellula sp.]
MHGQIFDIFEFLNIARREDVLHTPMLAGLLDPFGAHGLGSLFLGKFLELLSCPQLQLTREDAEEYDWVVKREHTL